MHERTIPVTKNIDLYLREGQEDYLELRLQGTPVQFMGGLRAQAAMAVIDA
jgi:hypothetical protein